MSINISQELRQTFQLAALRKEARSLRTASDWEKGNEIITRYDRGRKKLNRQYYSEYDSHVEKVTQKLIDKGGAKEKNFVHRFLRSDNFDKSAIARQAHRIVQHDHQRRLSALDTRETSELEGLTRSAVERDQTREKPKQDFARAVDRRSGQERRQSVSRSRS